MAIIIAKTPRLVKRFFPMLRWSFSSSEKIIYLTFDDGPTPEITDWTLQTLANFNAKATFFCIGKNISQFSDITQHIVNGGHRIANHCYNHDNAWKSTAKDYLVSIKNTENLLERFQQNGTKLFRPPYGKLTYKKVKQLRQKNYQIIMWDVLSNDVQQNVSPEKSLQTLLKKTKNGSIVVFHDSVKGSVTLKEVLPKFLKYFGGLGFEFRAIK